MNTNVDTYYFLGIGGIGMSALARYFAAKGNRVLGYDRTPSPITEALTQEGIEIQYDDCLDRVKSLDSAKTIVVRTPAVPSDMAIYVWLKENGFVLLKRAEVLGLVTRSERALCVAGTHGKTTTSTLLAHILHQSHLGTNAFLGGIANNYGTNLLLNKSNHVVVEADEYDRSFHHLTPYMSVITSIDPDHLDIYGSEEAYRESFEKYATLVDHTIILKHGLELKVSNLRAKVYRYAVDGIADFHAENIHILDGEIWFDFHTPKHVIENIQLGVPVWINIENSVAAMAVAWLLGATDDELRDGVRTFSGVYRRFNSHVSTPQVSYIDDYAHHPIELKACVDSVRKLYPDRYIIGVFQPHLFSRTKDFADDFASVLSDLDEVALLPIYPAREKPIEGVTSDWLLEKITIKRALVLPEILAKYLRERVKHCIKKGKACTVITMGAGDIDRRVNEIQKALTL
jgi:UDP-N-acetylmuramate--alanine ligase